MGEFEYFAIDSEGARKRGAVSAASVEEAQSALRRQGLVVTRLKNRAASAFGFGRDLAFADLASGLRAIADALQAGLPIAKALDLASDLAPPSWSRVLPSIRESVRLGQPLSNALASGPLRPPPMVRSLAAAGEASGLLGPALQRAAEYCDQRARLESDLRQALAYPALLAVSGAVTLALMLGIVLPRFALILTDMGQTLPTSTRIVLQAAEFGRTALIGLAAIAVASAVAIASLLRRADGRRLLHALMLRLWGVGQLRSMMNAARLSDSLALLLESGVPIRRSLRLAAEATGDAEVAHRADRAEEDLRTGASLSQALASHGVASDVVVRLVRSGELTSDVPKALRHASRFERERAERRIRILVRALEPSLILVFAGLVGAVAVAMLQAVYALRPV